MDAQFADEVVAALELAQTRIHIGHCITQAWGVLENGAEAYCALGALARSSRTRRIFDAGHEALRVMLPTGSTSVADYNDASSTAEVSRLYGNAISAVRQAVA
jgi:hypothetical protein